MFNIVDAPAVKCTGRMVFAADFGWPCETDLNAERIGGGTIEA
jgi:hypothetical protein